MSFRRELEGRERLRDEKKKKREERRQKTEVNRKRKKDVALQPTVLPDKRPS